MARKGEDYTIFKYGSEKRRMSKMKTTKLKNLRLRISDSESFQKCYVLVVLELEEALIIDEGIFFYQIS